MSWYAYASLDSPPSHTLLDQNLDPRVIMLNKLARWHSMQKNSFIIILLAIKSTTSILGKAKPYPSEMEKNCPRLNQIQDK